MLWSWIKTIEKRDDRTSKFNLFNHRQTPVVILIDCSIVFHRIQKDVCTLPFGTAPLMSSYKYYTTRSNLILNHMSNEVPL